MDFLTLDRKDILLENSQCTAKSLQIWFLHAKFYYLPALMLKKGAKGKKTASPKLNVLAMPKTTIQWADKVCCLFSTCVREINTNLGACG